MKKYSLPIVILTAIMTLLMASCSNGAEDELKSLLQTVPSDAAVVGVANLESINEKIEQKHSEKDSLKSLLVNTIGAQTISQQQSLTDLLEGKAGIKPGCLVYFEAAHDYITGLIDDEKEFKAYVEKYTRSKFQKEGDFMTAGNTAYRGSQFWMQTSGSIDTEELTSLTRLTKTQSFLTTRYADKMLKLDHDISLISSFNRYVRTTGRSSMEMNLISAALFDDASFVACEFDLTGNKNNPLGCKLNGEILNSKFKPAKFLLPTSTIDVEAVKKMDGRGNTIIAMAVSHKLIDKISKMASSFGGGLPTQMSDILKTLDGTMACSTDGVSLQGFITAGKGEGKTLENLLSTYTDMPFIGNYSQLQFTSAADVVKFSMGVRPLGKEVTTVAPEFKDAMFAFWTNKFDYGDYVKDMNVPFNGTMLIRLLPKDGSLTFELTIK